MQHPRIFGRGIGRGRTNIAPTIPSKLIPSMPMFCTVCPFTVCPCTVCPYTIFPCTVVPARFVPAWFIPARFVPARFVPARFVPTRFFRTDCPCTISPCTLCRCPFFPRKFLLGLCDADWNCHCSERAISIKDFRFNT